MKYSLKNVVYECKKYWILSVPSGYEVYKKGICLSTRCVQIGFTGHIGLTKAMKHIELRLKEDNGNEKTID